MCSHLLTPLLFNEALFSFAFYLVLQYYPMCTLYSSYLPCSVSLSLYIAISTWNIHLSSQTAQILNWLQTLFPTRSFSWFSQWIGICRPLEKSVFLSTPFFHLATKPRKICKSDWPDSRIRIEQLLPRVVLLPKKCLYTPLSLFSIFIARVVLEMAEPTSGSTSPLFWAFACIILDYGLELAGLQWLV